MYRSLRLNDAIWTSMKDELNRLRKPFFCNTNG